MNFCENCRIVFGQEYCPRCGNKKTRLVKDDDFCYLTERGISDCVELTDTFEQNGIPYTELPSGNAVRSCFALRMENYKIFVPWKYLEDAKEILKYFADRETEVNRKTLLESENPLFVSQKTVKRFRKKLKLEVNDGFFDYCTELIKRAEYIVDKGLISDCIKGGRYLYCYAGDTVLVVNSVTSEILDFFKR